MNKEAIFHFLFQVFIWLYMPAHGEERSLA